MEDDVQEEMQQTLEDGSTTISNYYGRITVSKSYKRKVNLVSISTQYDNLEASTYASLVVDSDDKIPAAMEVLYKIVHDETENDIKKHLDDMRIRAKDKANDPYLGLGPYPDAQKIEDSSPSDEPLFFDDATVEGAKDEQLFTEEDVPEQKPKSDKKAPDILEDIDLDSFDPNEFQGDFFK